MSEVEISAAGSCSVMATGILGYLNKFWVYQRIFEYRAPVRLLKLQLLNSKVETTPHQNSLNLNHVVEHSKCVCAYPSKGKNK